jgi:predicted nucleic acid-binding protein
MIYVLDTNIVIHYLRNTPRIREQFNDAVLRGDDLIIPKIVDYEIMRGFRIFSAPTKVSAYKVLITNGFCSIVEPDISSWERAETVYAELYHKRFTVDEFDILIAAFCLEQQRQGGVTISN